MQFQLSVATAFAAFLISVVRSAPVDTPPPTCVLSTELVGDGGSQLAALHKQVSETIACGDVDTCTASYITSYTVGYSISSGANLGEWITGGFSVSESWTTGNSYSCSAPPGHTTCVYYGIAYMQYNVQNFYTGGCSPDPGTPYVLTSPITDNAGGGFFCGTDSQCGDLGQESWLYGHL